MQAIRARKQAYLDKWAVKKQALLASFTVRIYSLGLALCRWAERIRYKSGMRSLVYSSSDDRYMRSV